MHTSGYPQSIQNPPTNSMFFKAGTSEWPILERDTSMTQSFTQMAKEISKAVSPQSKPHIKSQAGSSGRMIDAHSRFYKQLSELFNLKSSGIDSEEEYHNYGKISSNGKS